MTFKWHKFLAYFALWVNMIFSGITGITSLTTGFRYMGWSGGYGFLLLLLGGLYLYLAILSASAAVQLLRFDWSGVKKLKTLYTISIITGVISLFSDASASNLISLVISVIMLLVNNAYYDNRSEYFH